MKVLLDECIPVRVKTLFHDIDVKSVNDMKWSSLKNGELLKIASENNFDYFLTLDKNLQYQQNIRKTKIAIIIFDVSTSKIEEIKPLIPKFIKQINRFNKGEAYLISK